MSSNIKKLFKDNTILVFIVKHTEYREGVMAINKIASELFEKICYISLAKSYIYLSKEFEKEKIPLERFIFIDCVTSRMMIAKDTEKIFYLPSTATLMSKDSEMGYLSLTPKFTDLNKTVSDVLRQKTVKINIFDSISAMFLYMDSAMALEIVHSIILSFRASKAKAIFILFEEDIDINQSKSFFKDLKMFADKTTRL